MIEPAEIAASRLLIVAPHPDDETLGCGGLVAAKCRQGAAVCVLFITDGGASHPGSRLWPRARLAAIREQEAQHALELLGAGSQPRHFLRLPDANMPAAGAPAYREACARLVKIIAEFAPDLALLPWRRDPHRDHRDAWALITDAMAQAGAGQAAVATLEYAIWLDELGVAADFPRPNECTPVVVDVSAVQAAKRAAVNAHVSQISALIDDDPTGFRLSAATIERLCGPREVYWRPLP